MALNIKDERADRLVRELAAETGESLTTAVTVAVTERLQRVRGAVPRERRAEMLLVAVDADQAQLARAAFARFGKRQAPAGLNFGDCFAYALAQALGRPLLFKGADFAQTDVPAAA